MKIQYDKSFERDLKKINDKGLIKRILLVVEEIGKADQIQSVTNIKKMQGYNVFYRARVGDYRIGFRLVDAETVKLIKVAHRSEIYRVFP